MNEEENTKNLLLDSTVNGQARTQCSIAAKQLLQKWGSGSGEDLASALSSEPILSADRSIFLDLVQTEYRSKKRELSQQSLDAFCSRFSGLISDELAHSVQRLIEVEQYLSECPDLLELVNEADWPAEGEEFDEFVLLAEIGRGASSRVFLAEQPSLGNRLVVLKVMPVTFNEASIVANLIHKNVVTIHSTGLEETSGLNWICMPFLGRRTMQQAINDGFYVEQEQSGLDTRRPKIDLFKNQKVLHEEHVIWLAIMIAKGIAYIQTQGIYHGDLKPSNILLTDQGTPVLIDFNLAQSTSIETRRVGGTLPYMAPEHLQLLATSNFVDCLNTSQSEVFAYGVVLYEMLTSEHPYCKQDNSIDYQESAAKILESKKASEDAYITRLKDFDPRLRKLIKNCLSSNAKDRPSSFEEIVKSLEDMRTNASRVTRFMRRRPATVIAMLALLVTLTIGCAAFYPTALDYLTIKRADWELATGEYSQAIKILAPYVESHPKNLQAKRKLASAYLSGGDFKSAKKHFNPSWRLSKDPLDSAMVGYCSNLDDQPDASISDYAVANQVVGFFNVAVNHNYSKKLLSILMRYGADSETSEKIEQLLVNAHQAAPDNQSVKMLMMRHAIFNHRNRQKIPASYKLPMILVDLDHASTAVCSLTLEYLAICPLDKYEQGQLGFNYLRKIVAYRGYGDVMQSTRPDLLEPYRYIVEFNKLKETPRQSSPSVPDSYLNPLDWCSQEARDRYFSGLSWENN